MAEGVLFRRFGIGFIHKGENHALILQALQIRVGIQRHQGKSAHDQQTRNGDAYRCKRHKAVREHIGDALMEKILKIVLFHDSAVPLLVS